MYTHTLRFVDRDMMMRYLGWGIGHRNPPDFAHEANALIASSLDRELESHPNHAGGGDVEGGSVGSELNLGPGGESDAESIHSDVDMYDY